MRRTVILLAATLMAVAFVGCEKERVSSLGARMENLSYTNEEGQKVYLTHNEEWLYWEDGDAIKVFVGDVTDRFHYMEGAGTQHAQFHSDEYGVERGAEAYAIYPYHANAGRERVVIPNEQPYREHLDPYADLSFGKGVIPMVAYQKKGVDFDSSLYFHVVCGILRLQLYSTSNEEYTIQEVTIKEISDTPKQISGPFNVNNIKQNAPYVTATDASGDNLEMTITGINQPVGGGYAKASDNMWFFYLPLPAITSASTTTNYKLRLTVKTTDAKKAVHYFSKTFSTPIRRANISKMQALDIRDWSTSAGDGNTDQGVARLSIVGEGTQSRPFQIYYLQELVAIRDSINNGKRINGKVINSETYFKLMRSDITLTTSNWTHGIENFTGKLISTSASANTAGIINNSHSPVFESIGSGGWVEGLVVSGTETLALPSGTKSYSPFCTDNYGYMVDCHNKTNVTITSSNKNLAGLCVRNMSGGVIVGGANRGTLVSTANVAGICVENYGIVQGNFTLSNAAPSATNIAGICTTNEGSGVIQDCMVSVNNNVNSSGNWGLVAFENFGKMKNCKSVGELTITTTGSIGGIVNTMNSASATIHDCSNLINLYGGSGSIGGIVAFLQNGEVSDCYSSVGRNLYVAGGGSVDYAGGIVGYMTGGNVRNCYSRTDVQMATNCGGIVGRLETETVSPSTPDIENCWNDYTNLDFYGNIESGVIDAATCYNKAHQTGVTQFSTTTNYNVGGTPLYTLLNTWQASHTTYNEWSSQGALQIPVFISSKKGGKPRR
ncbi:MAG: hypothetical protein K5864_09585 [Bacteroidales bacterium]|nr:hypothetical protein [Bacteroidales bacterium]